MKIGVIILARTNFGRWPDKILFPLAGKPMFEWVIEKCFALGVDTVIVSTTDQVEDQIIADTAQRLGAEVSYGPPDDRNARYVQAIIEHNLDYFIPVSPAAPFFDVEFSREVISAIRNKPDHDYYVLGDSTQNSAVVRGYKAQAAIDMFESPNRDQEIFVDPRMMKGYRCYDWFEKHVRNRYLFDCNVAYKIQAQGMSRICDYLGHFPEVYEEIMIALMEVEL